jgi:branched-chain amino acid transport system permease protein
MKKQNEKLYTILALCVLAVLIYFAEKNLDAYNLRILNLGAIYVTLGVSLNLIFGFTGQFSLGHAGFMAIGAYVTTLLVLPCYAYTFYSCFIIKWITVCTGGNFSRIAGVKA